MRHVIDRNDWERWDNFRFFMDFPNPFFSITSEVECGPAKEMAKRKGESFFVHYLYAVLRSVNEIEALRYRLEGEDYDQIVLYDTVDIITTIRTDGNGRFSNIRIPYIEDRDEFVKEATRLVRETPKQGDPFAVESEGGMSGRYDVVMLSAVPDLYFTSSVATQKHRWGSDYPLMNIGKAVTREGRLVFPVSISAHHGFVDGFHVAQFMSKIEKYLTKV